MNQQTQFTPDPRDKPPRRARGLGAVSIVLVVLGALALFVSLSGDGRGTALADPDPPGNDGVCEHANSEQPCRPDPQPEHGKDCEAHGANFDGNEDHCLPATEEATVPPTNTSVPPTNTSVPPTNTSVPPTNTSVPPTNTSVPPTNTSVPPTNTSVPPTATMTATTEAPGIVITVTPTEQAVSAALPPAAPVEVEEEVEAVSPVAAVAAEQQAVSAQQPTVVTALPTTGSGGDAGGQSVLFWGALALLATGGGLALASWRMRQS